MRWSRSRRSQPTLWLLEDGWRTRLGLDLGTESLNGTLRRDVVHFVLSSRIGMTLGEGGMVIVNMGGVAQDLLSPSATASAATAGASRA